MRARTKLGWLMALAAAAELAAAHHSITGQYDLTERLTLRGVIARVDWINPHPYVYLDVARADGANERWALAAVPLPMLRKAGVTREDVAGTLGDTVTIDVLPGLEGRKQGWILRIGYPDGRFILISNR